MNVYEFDFWLFLSAIGIVSFVCVTVLSLKRKPMVVIFLKEGSMSSLTRDTFERELKADTSRLYVVTMITPNSQEPGVQVVV